MISTAGAAAARSTSGMTRGALQHPEINKTGLGLNAEPGRVLAELPHLGVGFEAKPLPETHVVEQAHAACELGAEGFEQPRAVAWVKKWCLLNTLRTVLRIGCAKSRNCFAPMRSHTFALLAVRVIL